MMKSKNEMRGFGSDNNAGIHPDIIKEIISVNTGHVIGYGSDIYTERALGIFKEQFGSSTETFFVFTGTAANVLSLSGITRSWNSVIILNRMNAVLLKNSPDVKF
jgi:threonine aldolase